MRQGFSIDVINPKNRKPIHPEMADVQPGDKLMGVTFINGDSMNDDLKRRIRELEAERILKAEQNEEDDDDDGADGAKVPALV